MSNAMSVFFASLTVDIARLIIARMNRNSVCLRAHRIRIMHGNDMLAREQSITCTSKVTVCIPYRLRRLGNFQNMVFVTLQLKKLFGVFKPIYSN